jgi:hypothetical protein
MAGELPAGFPEVVESQGITVRWGGVNIVVTGIRYNRSAAGEVDVTGIRSFAWTDAANSDNRRVVKEVEYSVIDPGEVECDFVGPSTFDESWVGNRRLLTISGLDNAPSGVQAYLTNLSIQARAGELVTGSCTFRLSSDMTGVF